MIRTECNPHGPSYRACLSQGGRKGHAALLRSETQLQLLMRMASAGSAAQHQAAAQRLVATNAIARLSQVEAAQNAVMAVHAGSSPQCAGQGKAVLGRFG